MKTGVTVVQDKVEVENGGSSDAGDVQRLRGPVHNQGIELERLR